MDFAAAAELDADPSTSPPVEVEWRTAATHAEVILHRLLGLPLRHPLLHVSGSLVRQSMLDRLWAHAAAAAAAAHPPQSNWQLELRVSPTLCRPGRPVQFGLFVRRLPDFDSRRPRVVCRAGAFVAPYGGLLRHRLDIERAGGAVGLSMRQAKSHARRLPGHDYAFDGLPLAWMLRRPIPRDWTELRALVDADVDEMLPTSGLFFSAAEASLFRRSELGFMCNTADVAAGQSNNVRVEYRSTSLGGGLTLDLPLLMATADLREGDELLSPYRNAAANAHDWANEAEWDGGAAAD
jgi:hypothetical protein